MSFLLDNLVTMHLLVRWFLPINPRRNRKGEKVTVKAGQVAPVYTPARHRVTEELPSPCQFFPAALPTGSPIVRSEVPGPA